MWSHNISICQQTSFTLFNSCMWSRNLKTCHYIILLLCHQHNNVTTFTSIHCQEEKFKNSSPSKALCSHHLHNIIHPSRNCCLSPIMYDGYTFHTQPTHSMECLPPPVVAVQNEGKFLRYSEKYTQNTPHIQINKIWCNWQAKKKKTQTALNQMGPNYASVCAWRRGSWVCVCVHVRAFVCVCVCVCVHGGRGELEGEFTASQHELMERPL